MSATIWPRISVIAEHGYAGTGRAAVLLDRDGTIVADQAYANDPAALCFEEGALEGLAKLSALGLPLVIVTNQSAIGRGLCSVQQVDVFNAELASRLSRSGISISGYYVCPHAPGDDCACRKPLTGLAIQAATAHRLALKKCFVIGDKGSDLALAQAIGATGILVLSGYGPSYRRAALARGIAICNDLVEAAELITARLQSAGANTQ